MADAMNTFYTVFAQETLSEGNGGSSFTVDSQSVSTTALAGLSKVANASVSDISNFLE